MLCEVVRHHNRRTFYDICIISRVLEPSKVDGFRARRGQFWETNRETYKEKVDKKAGITLKG